MELRKRVKIEQVRIQVRLRLWPADDMLRAKQITSCLILADVLMHHHKVYRLMQLMICSIEGKHLLSIYNFDFDFD